MILLTTDDGRQYTAFESSPRGKKHYRSYIASAIAEVTAAGQPPFTLATEELHQAVIRHLRAQIRDPNTWLPGQLQQANSETPIDESRVRREL